MTPITDPTLSRRRLLQTGLLATAATAFGPGFWRQALAASATTTVSDGPYGPLLAPDANGISLPAGFSSREIARAGRLVDGTGYLFPVFPDGQATYATPDGGWILVTNSEIPLVGGVSAIRFDATGKIVDAYRILGGTSTNCAGGPTPWGTWLSCEEVDDGWVWECDPTGARDAVKHEAMGRFKHEAACVDPFEQVVYLTEDLSGGGLYRFTPDDYPDLSSGLLEVACDGGGGLVVWRPVPNPRGGSSDPTREQVAGMIPFARGEGIWFDAGIVYVATTGDETIHAYETATGRLSTLYRADDVEGTPLRGVDNVHVSRSGDVFVAEDSYENDPDAMDVCIITPEGEVARFLKLTGGQHFLPGALQSETIGVCFDPSGTRMYVGSQRAWGTGVVYEISGPFRTERPSGAVPGGAPVAPLPPAPPAPAPETGGDPAGGGPAPVVLAGAPLGLDVAKRIDFGRLARKGLALGLTLDAPARVRATLSVSLPAGRGKRRRQVIARLDRRPGRGMTTLRLKAVGGRRGRELLARRRGLTGTLEVRITTPGERERVLRRTVRLTPAPRPKAKRPRR